MSLEQGQQIVFGPFRLDPSTGQLKRGEQAVALEPKPPAVLQYLAQHPGEIVTKQELLDTVWAGTVVTKAVVKECVRAIRGALDEEATTPQYLETVGREGYRFQGEGNGEAASLAVENTDPRPQWMVGRGQELSRLQHWLTTAEGGTRQLLFLTGEPGIGKTTLVDRFLGEARAAGRVRIGRGQCIEQHGQGEAYLPMLEALGQLCREQGGNRMKEVLWHYAPSWLAQLPAVLAEEEHKALQEQDQGVTQRRMLREIAEALEAFTADLPLLLVFEDLHWSDHSTLELIAHLARRRERARLLVVGTYRPADAVISGHPLKGLKQELQAHGQCEELRLEQLTEAEVAEYVAGRFAGTPFAAALGRVIHRRTDGNPLFMVNIVEDLIRQGIIAEKGERWEMKGDLAQINVPDTLRQLIEKQIAQLSENEQRVLEVASVTGTEFAAAAVAAGLKQEPEVVEDACEDLAWQGHFLEERGIAEWADGTVSGRYEFRHALYQNVLYERIAEARRIRLHKQIGERIEIGYGEQSREVAAELAMHFERGRDYQRAVQYLRRAAENANRRSANREAIDQLTTALALLPKLPDTPKRLQQEVAMQSALGTALMAVKGFASAEVEHVHARLRQLCRHLEVSPTLFRALPALRGFYLVRGELQTARELAEQLLALAQRIQFPPLLVWAYYGLGETLVWSGEMCAARGPLEQGSALYDPQQLRAYFSPAVQDPGVACLTCLASALWAMGYPTVFS